MMLRALDDADDTNYFKNHVFILLLLSQVHKNRNFVGLGGGNVFLRQSRGFASCSIAGASVADPI